MVSPATRRRFIEMAPFASVALLAACSPPPPPSPVNTAPPAPSTQPPAPAADAPASPPASSTPSGATTTSASPMLDEKDPQAVALGYVPDASRVDKDKYKTYVAGSMCSNCNLYQGKAGDATGPCTLFTGKNVAGPGWCSGWIKKA
jgi:High potential iron-sulfur protein